MCFIVGVMLTESGSFQNENIWNGNAFWHIFWYSIQQTIFSEKQCKKIYCLVRLFWQNLWESIILSCLWKGDKQGQKNQQWIHLVLIQSVNDNSFREIQFKIKYCIIAHLPWCILCIVSEFSSLVCNQNRCLNWKFLTAALMLACYVHTKFLMYLKFWILLFFLFLFVHDFSVFTWFFSDVKKYK